MEIKKEKTRIKENFFHFICTAFLIFFYLWHVEISNMEYYGK
jgi:hypothetical protein